MSGRRRNGNAVSSLGSLTFEGDSEEAQSRDGCDASLFGEGEAEVAETPSEIAKVTNAVTWMLIE